MRWIRHYLCRDISERKEMEEKMQYLSLKELKMNAGIQFDPELVKVFIEKVLNKPVN